MVDNQRIEERFKVRATLLEHDGRNVIRVGNKLYLIEVEGEGNLAVQWHDSDSETQRFQPVTGPMSLGQKTLRDYIGNHLKGFYRDHSKFPETYELTIERKGLLPLPQPDEQSE